MKICILLLVIITKKMQKIQVFDEGKKIGYIPHRYLSFQVFHQLAEILDYVS